jgi:hypothetical protein
VADALQNADEAMDTNLSPLDKEVQEKMADDLQQNANMGLKESAAADDELRVVYDDLHEAEETDVHHEADDDVQEADGDHLESADDQPSSDADASDADVLVVEGEDKLLEFEIMFGLIQAKEEPANDLLVEDAPHPLLEDEPHGQEAVISYENYDYGEIAGQTGNCSLFIKQIFI